MAPLPLELLPGIDLCQMEQLLQFNLHLVRDLARIPAATLATAIGPVAFAINQLARGIDQTPVLLAGEPKPTVYEEHTLADPTNCMHTLTALLFSTIARATAKVRAMGLAVGGISVRIRYADGATATRSAVVQPPLSGDLSLFNYTLPLFKKCFTRRVRLTEIAVTCSELTFPYGQLDLFAETEREEHLMSALDDIRNNFGRSAIRFWGREHVG